MRKNQSGLRSAVLAALAAVGVTAHAATPINAFFSFDNVVSGSDANAALGSWASSLSFANPDMVPDVNGEGAYTGTWRWVDATASYGPVKVLADPGNALSPDKVLANDHQSILVSFSNPVTITRFSIAQDNSGLGNLTPNGSYLVFLDATGHEIAGASVSYTQYGNPGLTIQNFATVANVSGVLLAGGRNYDNLYVNAVAAVPEPETWAMLSGGLLLMAAMIRRRGCGGHNPGRSQVLAG